MSLEDWRTEIDRIDLEIMNLLQRRIRIVEEIGKVKEQSGLPLVDENREKFIVNRALNARREPLSVEAVNCIFNCIIQESRRVQIDYQARIGQQKEISETA